jgi:hypothetical protein
MKRDYHAEWLRTKAKLLVRRAVLIGKLGGKCQKCGSTETLEPDHPNGKTWESRKLSPQMRQKQHEKDFENGELSLLCRSCNGKDGAINKSFYGAQKEEVPF